VALYRNNVGHSTYHSLQTRLEQRFSRGLSVTGAYTFSKLIDDAGAVFDAAIMTGPAGDVLELCNPQANLPHQMNS
jgi:hypothetical protein